MMKEGEEEKLCVVIKCRFYGGTADKVVVYHRSELGL